MLAFKQPAVVVLYYRFGLQATTGATVESRPAGGRDGREHHIGAGSGRGRILLIHLEVVGSVAPHLAG